MKRASTDARLCRDLFFSGPPKRLADGTMDDFGISDQDVARYQAHFAEDCKATVDTVDLNHNLPSKAVDAMGLAKFASTLPPAFVLGATRDIIVDYEALLETSSYFGLEDPPVLLDSGHDTMLGRNWLKTAEIIHAWIKGKL